MKVYECMHACMVAVEDIYKEPKSSNPIGLLHNTFGSSTIPYYTADIMGVV